jgi:predicted  nucleic acid-binding Zn-ribbon protein
VYIGEIVHKGKHYPGEHPSILDLPLFEAVQDVLDRQAQSRRHARINTESLLTGKIFDDRGNRMTPATAKKGAARYRYVSAALNQGKKQQAGSVARVPAAEIEAAVIKALREASGRSAETDSEASSDTDGDVVEQHLERVTIRKGRLDLTLWDTEASASRTITAPWSASSSSRNRQIILPQSAGFDFQQPIRSESRARLVEGIARGRYWLTQLTSGEVRDTKEIAKRERCSERSVRMTLSPSVQP